MDYLKFGRTGLEVSRICLGCMSYGEPGRGAHPWTLPEQASRPFIRRALDLGINFFDLANTYSAGSSEEIVGRALLDFTRREEVVIATKVYNRMRPGPNGMGLSRKAILFEIDASLKRLGTDYVDLYQIHRWDSRTPIEETMEALHDVVKAGKARYIGASTMWAWQFSKAQHVAESKGWTRFVSMQNFLNLLYREEEREMLPLCRDQGVAVMPWSPLGRGRLARPWEVSSSRTESDDVTQRLLKHTQQSDRAIVEAVQSLAARRSVSMAQIALAWVLRQPGVASPLIGATRLEHLEEAVAALKVQLSDAECVELEQHYQARSPFGHAA
jgi:aryl-alcohol dehydrogenase-like predicted oxidoreductase